MSKIDELNSKIKSIQEEIKNAGKEAFYEVLKPIFDKYPDVKTVSWRQYTPYFNDGDTCEFGVCNDYSSIDVDGDDYYSSGDNKQKEIIKEFGSILSKINEDIYLKVFGDHVKITSHSDGNFDVEEYDHD